MFTPDSPGKQFAALTITSDASNAVAPITLSGVGRPGKLVFKPHALRFGKVPSGSTSAVKTVMLINKNPVPMSLGRPSIYNPEFQIQSTACGATLAAGGGTCGISMVFAPNALRLQKGSLQLAGNFASAGGLNLPRGVALDSAGNIWVANFGSSGAAADSLSELTASGALAGNSIPAGANFNGLWSVALDGTGNIWVTNYSGNSVTEVLGAAKPLLTPPQACLQAGQNICVP